jgi:hypothetical protein
MPHMKRRANLFLVLIGMGLFAMLVVMILLMTPARASITPDTGLPAGITCEMVREKVAEHGKAAALAWAFERGLSIRQIYIIRRACKV